MELKAKLLLCSEINKSIYDFDFKIISVLFIDFKIFKQRLNYNCKSPIEYSFNVFALLKVISTHI